MQVDNNLEASSLGPADCLVKERKLAVDIWLSLERDNSPVANRNTDEVQSCLSYLLKVGLSDKAAPVLNQLALGRFLAKGCAKRPLVDSRVPNSIKERRSDPRLKHEPATEVYTAYFLAAVAQRGSTRLNVAEGGKYVSGYIEGSWAMKATHSFDGAASVIAVKKDSATTAF